MKWKKMGPWGI